MSTPITWRNIETPNFQSAAIGMTTVGSNLEAARKLLTQSIAETERIDAENWDNTKANNTNAVLRRLMEYQDPESFEKARQAGEFLALMDQYGGQIDANLVRKSIDERADILRNRAINALDYQNRLRMEEEAKVAREQKPIVDRLLGLVEQGELKPATEAARIYADSGMLREDFLRQTLEAARKRQEGIEDRNLRELEVKSTIGYRNAQAAAAKAQIEAARAQKDAAKWLTADKQWFDLVDKVDRNYAERYKEWLDKSILGQGSLEDPKGRDAMAGIFKTFNLTPNAQQDVWENLEKYFPGGYYTRTVDGKEMKIPIPVELVYRALMNTDEIGDGSWWSRRGDKVATYIQKLMEDPRIVKEIEEAKRIQEWRDTARNLAAMDPQAAVALPYAILAMMRQWGPPMNSSENKK